MTRPEWLRLVARINVLWPHRVYGPEWVEAAWPFVADLPAELVSEGLTRYVATATGGWPPTVSELLAAAGIGPPNAARVLTDLVQRPDALPEGLRRSLYRALGGSHAVRSLETGQLLSRTRLALAEEVIADWYVDAGRGELVQRRLAVLEDASHRRARLSSGSTTAREG